MSAARSVDEIRGDLGVALWKGYASSSYDALPAIRRLAEDVPALLALRVRDTAAIANARALVGQLVCGCPYSPEHMEWERDERCERCLILEVLDGAT